MKQKFSMILNFDKVLKETYTEINVSHVEVRIEKNYPKLGKNINH